MWLIGKLVIQEAEYNHMEQRIDVTKVPGIIANAHTLRSKQENAMGMMLRFPGIAIGRREPEMFKNLAPLNAAAGRHSLTEQGRVPCDICAMVRVYVPTNVIRMLTFSRRQIVQQHR